MDGQLAGKVAIVTGSSSGIGAAVARRFAAEGATVVVSSSRSVEQGTAVAESLPNATYHACNVADEEQVRRLVDDTAERFGRIDVLVNNAGTTRIIPHGDLDAATADIWREIIDVNIIGTWSMCVAAMPHLKANGDGAIVNVTSLGGVRPGGSSIPYAVTKAGLNHLTRLLAKACGPEVRVNAVAPGLVATPWTDGWPAHEHVANVAPMRRSGQPEDIAEVVITAATAKYMTGQVVVVDGGLGLVI